MTKIAILEENGELHIDEVTAKELKKYEDISDYVESIYDEPVFWEKIKTIHFRKNGSLIE